MNMGAFGIIALLEEPGEKNLSYQDYSNLGATRPLISAFMAIFMFSLAGIPPFGGFFGKYYVFAAAIQADLTWLAIVGVLSSVIGVYYYLRLVVYMYFHDGVVMKVSELPRLSIVCLGVSALILFQLGVYPSVLLSIIQSAF